MGKGKFFSKSFPSPTKILTQIKQKIKMKEIIVKNAKENNLKSVSVTIPRDKLVVFTGLSGSGKSSLAFDTIFAEGQRRYMESLSSYARQFLGLMEKPDVESIEGLSPAISIDQKTTSSNPRSTVGTVTEIYDYLRLLFARVGTPYCPHCGHEIKKTGVDQICDRVAAYPVGTKLQILAPVVRGRKGEFTKLFEQLKKQGFVRVIVDGNQYTLDEEIKLEKNIKHNISVVVDRLVVKDEMNSRLAESVETALKLADGLMVVSTGDEETTFSDKFACPECGFTIEEMEPRSFSFNSPFGACPECSGLGFKQEFDERLILPDDSKSLHGNAIRLLGFNLGAASWMRMLFDALADKYGFSCDVPVRELPKSVYNTIMYGNGGEALTCYLDDGRSFNTTWEGIIPMMTRRHAECKSDWTRQEYEKFMVDKPCSKCRGKRLKDEILAVKVGGLNIWEVGELSVVKALDFFETLALDETKAKIAYLVLKEIKARLRFLVDVGLGYLTLNRSAGTLSGGEAQRIRLATQIGSGLTGVLYILDEPSIGLHQRDNAKLIATLTKLRDVGNTLIVVEHDEDTIRAADFVVDVGPGAGVHGGEIVCAGTVQDVMNCPESITGKYLSGELSIPVPTERRKGNGHSIVVHGARKNNLKNIDVEIPRDKLVVFTGLSGSGKSSLAFDTIFAEGQRRYIESLSSYARMFLGQMEKPDVEYIEGLSPAVSIDQKTTSKNPRSTVGTVTEIYDYLRLLYARVGTPHCPKCGREIEHQTVDQITDKIIESTVQSGDNKVIIMAPVVRGRKGEYRKELEDFKKSGYVRVRVDGIDYTLDEEIILDKNVKHDISVTIDRIAVKEGSERRLTDSVEAALKLANGLVVVENAKKTTIYSTKYSCPDCDVSIEELEPRLFSFNNPYGACPECGGLGFRNEIDLKKIIVDENLGVGNGGLAAPSGWNLGSGDIVRSQMKALSKVMDFSLTTPIKDLPKWKLDAILYGVDERIPMDYNSRSFRGQFMTKYEGIVNNLMRRYRETTSDGVKYEIERYMVSVPCKTCGGKRLKKEALAVTVGGLNIAELSDMSVKKIDEFFGALVLDKQKTLIAERIIKEIRARLKFLVNVGLDYLTLSRSASTLSGGESQRIRLATQIGSGLTGVLYILDEPSIGLHQKDNERLLSSLKGLRDLGNTLIVVEHDEDTMRAADYIVDIGPGAGIHGGKLVAAGSVDDIIACKESITGKYLSGELKIDVPKKENAPTADICRFAAQGKTI